MFQNRRLAAGVAESPALPDASPRSSSTAADPLSSPESVALYDSTPQEEASLTRDSCTSGHSDDRYSSWALDCIALHAVIGVSPQLAD